MAESPTTEILIRKTQQGDADAKGQLFDRFLARVLFLVRVRLGAKLRQKLDSWDIVQEAMLKSLGGLASFQYADDSAFLRYLVSNVERVIRDQADYWKAQKRDLTKEESLSRHRYAGSDLPLNTPDGRNEETPSEILSRSEDLDRLAAALDLLSAESKDYWELILAAKIEGRSYGDIAAEAQTTADAVKMKLRRAMVRLTRIYKSISGEPP